MELQMIIIHFLPYSNYYDDEDGNEDEARMPDWGTLTRILSYLQQRVALCSFSEDYDAEVEESQGLARAIHGNPMISKLHLCKQGPWCSAMVALPSLESVQIALPEPETEEDHVLLTCPRRGTRNWTL
jgi:hypothetical protein